MGLPATLVLEDIDNTIQADFMSGTLKLVDGTFEERTAPVEGSYRHVPFGAQATFDSYGLVVTSFQLVGVGNTPALVGEINKIEKLFENARKWNSDPLRYSSTWLRWGAKDETTSGYKRALIFEGSMSFVSPSGQNVSPFMQAGQVRINIRVTRHPMWEADTTTSETSNLYNAVGEKYVTAPASSPGTAPSRIQRVEILNSSAGTINNVWVGLRNNHYGATSFTNVWEAESGTNGTDAADVADATVGDDAVSNGNRVDITPGTATMEQRWSQNIRTVSGTDAIATNKQYIGRYLVLGRFRLSAGSSTWGIQLKYGFTGGDQIPCEKVYFTDTNWRMIELGEVSFPAMGNRAYSIPGPNYSSTFALPFSSLFLWAERVSGAANLQFDCISLIPSESLCVIKNAGMTNNYFLNIFTYENDIHDSIMYSSAAAGKITDITIRNWYYPSGNDGAVIVAAAEGTTKHILSYIVDLQPYYIHRWLSYRS